MQDFTQLIQLLRGKTTDFFHLEQGALYFNLSQVRGNQGIGLSHAAFELTAKALLEHTAENNRRFDVKGVRHWQASSRAKGRLSSQQLKVGFRRTAGQAQPGAAPAPPASARRCSPDVTAVGEALQDRLIGLVSGGNTRWWTQLRDDLAVFRDQDNLATGHRAQTLTKLAPQLPRGNYFHCFSLSSTATGFNKRL